MILRKTTLKEFQTIPFLKIKLILINNFILKILNIKYGLRNRNRFISF